MSFNSMPSDNTEVNEANLDEFISWFNANHEEDWETLSQEQYLAMPDKYQYTSKQTGVLLHARRLWKEKKEENSLENLQKAMLEFTENPLAENSSDWRIPTWWPDGWDGRKSLPFEDIPQALEILKRKGGLDPWLWLDENAFFDWKRITFGENHEMTSGQRAVCNKIREELVKNPGKYGLGTTPASQPIPFEDVVPFEDVKPAETVEVDWSNHIYAPDYLETPGSTPQELEEMKRSTQHEPSPDNLIDVEIIASEVSDETVDNGDEDLEAGDNVEPDKDDQSSWPPYKQDRFTPKANDNTGNDKVVAEEENLEADDDDVSLVNELREITVKITIPRPDRRFAKWLRSSRESGGIRLSLWWVLFAILAFVLNLFAYADNISSGIIATVIAVLIVIVYRRRSRRESPKAEASKAETDKPEDEGKKEDKPKDNGKADEKANKKSGCGKNLITAVIVIFVGVIIVAIVVYFASIANIRNSAQRANSNSGGNNSAQTAPTPVPPTEEAPAEVPDECMAEVTGKTYPDIFSEASNSASTSQGSAAIGGRMVQVVQVIEASSGLTTGWVQFKQPGEPVIQQWLRLNNILLHEGFDNQACQTFAWSE